MTGKNSQVLDRYCSSIERIYVSPTASTETSSFRTMIIEICKSNVSEERLEDLKNILPWTKKVTEKSSMNEQTKELMAISTVGSQKGHNGSLHIQHSK